MAFKGEQPPWEANPDERDHWVSIKAAAKIFRKSEETIRLYCRAGTLRSFHDGFRHWVRLDFHPNRPIDPTGPCSGK